MLNLIHLLFYGANIVIRLEQMSGAQFNERLTCQSCEPCNQDAIVKKSEEENPLYTGNILEQVLVSLGYSKIL